MAAKSNRDVNIRKGKKLSNPVSTGGGGSTFEARVQASRLLAMCLGTVFPGVEDGRIVEVVFQSRIAGYHTDDLLCTVEDRYAERSRVLLQMKRGIAPLKSNEAFADSLRAAWLDFSRPEFQVGRDAIHIVYGSGAATAMVPAQKLSEWARYTDKPEDYLRKVKAVDFSSSSDRQTFGLIQALCEEVSEEPLDESSLHEFFKHLYFLPSDHDAARGNEYTYQLMLIQALLGDVDPRNVWGRLVEGCLGANMNAGSITTENLDVLIGSDLARRFAAHRSGQGLQRPPSLFAGGELTQLKSGRAGGEAPRLASMIRELSRDGVDGLARDEVPAARSDSVNKLISAQLDGIYDLIRQARYSDAREAAELLRNSLGEFDPHQRARWHQMRGACIWHLDGGAAAAEDFLRAAELCQDEDKFLAAGVRGKLLRGDFEGAIASGEVALQRFPGSLSVWLATTNARIARGDPIGLDDVPPDLRAEADALQMLAWSHGRQGDKPGAARISLEALEAKDANFFTREQAIALCLDMVAADGVNATFRMLNSSDAAALSRCVLEFSPREERLWKVQSPPVVAAAVDNLAKAMILLGRADEALTLIQEARGRGVDQMVVLRAHLEALCELGRPTDAIALGRPHIAQMPVDVVAAFAQIAAEVKDLSAVDECLAHLQTRGAQAKKLSDSLRAMRLTVVASIDQLQALKEIECVDLNTERSGAMLVACAQVLFNAKRIEEAKQCSLGALAQLGPEATGGERYLVAQALLHTHQISQAATILESLVRAGTFSELHGQLLYCYVRSGRLAKAKHLIDGLPEGWESHKEARGLAIELAQRAGDWELLSRLVPAQMRAAPQLLRSWLYKAMVAARDSRQAVELALAGAPVDLTGAPQEAVQLARLELMHDQVQQGLNRGYRLRRLNLDSTEIAALHVLLFITAGKRLPQLQASPLTVDAGTSVVLQNAQGAQLVFTLDPPELAGLPSTGEFLRRGSPEEAAILGKAVGAEVQVGSGVEDVTVFRIMRICSAHLRLLELSHLALKSSVAPSPIVQVFSVDDIAPSEGGLGFMVNQIRAGTEHANASLAAYGELSLTLGGLAKRMGRDLVDVILGWPQDGPQMQVSYGVNASRAAMLHLRSFDGPYLVDTAALVELAKLDCLHVLQMFPKLLITEHSLELLRDKHHRLNSDAQQGLAYELDGQLAIVQIQPAQMERERRLFQRALDAATSMCQVVPAYGTDDAAQETNQLARIFSEEEVAVVRAAVERGATLFALDTRLRGWATRLGVVGVCIQSVLRVARESRRLGQREFSIATMQMLCANRSFISVSAIDLLHTAYQGTNWLKLGLEGFGRQIVLPQSNVDSALNVAQEFFEAAVADGRCQEGAVHRLIAFLSKAFFLRSDRPWDIDDQLRQRFQLPSDVPEISDRYEALTRNAVRAGEVAARSGTLGVIQDVQLLYCSSPPWLAFVQDRPIQGDSKSGLELLPMSPSKSSLTIHSQQQHATEYEGDPQPIGQ